LRQIDIFVDVVAKRIGTDESDIFVKFARAIIFCLCADRHAVCTAKYPKKICI